MVVFSLFFGKLAKMPVRWHSLPDFQLRGSRALDFFAAGLTQSSNSLVGSSNLITKVYFPRLVIPLATVLSGVVDFGLALAVLVGMMAYYRQLRRVCTYFFCPLFVLLALVPHSCRTLAFESKCEIPDVRYIVPSLHSFGSLAARPSPRLWYSDWRKEPKLCNERKRYRRLVVHI